MIKALRKLGIGGRRKQGGQVPWAARYVSLDFGEEIWSGDRPRVGI